jgi:glycosyltransferase involved in cell wall biosynthesis
LGCLPADMNFRLLLGGLCDSPELLATIGKLPGWPRVDYKGLMSRSQMLEQMRAAFMALILYSDCPNHMDIRSNRLFEALAAGVPVIVPNFPKWQNFIGNYGCGLAVDPHDPSSIEQAITYLLNHPQEAEQMGVRGRKLFEQNFNWKGEEAKLLKLYEDILLAN